MNKQQKEVLTHQLTEEQKQLQWIERIYEKASEDTAERIAQLSSREDMENLQSIIYQKKYQEALKIQIDDALQDLKSNTYSGISDYLNACYEDGYVGAMYDITLQGIPIIAPVDPKDVEKALKIDSKLSKGLYNALGENVDNLKKAVRAEVSRGVASAKTWNEIANNLAKHMSNTPFNKAKNYAMRIVRTEGHRVQMQSQNDACHVAKKNGADIVKQWDSTMDGSTRPTHKLLDGQIRELDDPFEINGYQAMYPSNFGSAALDCNCRCAMLQRARWGLDEDELKTLQDKAEYFGLDKSKDFEDFKDKYLNATNGNVITKDMKDFIYKYSYGKSRAIGDYSQSLVDDKSGYRLTSDISTQKSLSDDEKKKTKELMNLINKQPVDNIDLYRIEYNDDGFQGFKEGDVIKFGIRSTSDDPEFIRRVFNGDDDGMSFKASKSDEKNFVEYIFKSSKHLDIKKHSAFADQNEHLVSGSYKVANVKHIPYQKGGYVTEKTPYSEYLKNVEHFTSKKGNVMVRYIDPEDGREKTMTRDKYTNGCFTKDVYKPEVIGRYVVELVFKK